MRYYAAILISVLLPSACASSAPAPPAPPSAPASARAYHAADIAFMQGMIGHHAQALVMTELVAERTTRETIRLMAERIDVSQQDEIAFMERWLRARGEPVPEHAAHMAMGHGELMPGMLTPAQLDTLRASRGTEFDRNFLRYMIQHHEGAITMVERLLATPGAGREPELYIFASDVNADQAAEIQRMERLLGTLRQP